MAFLTFSLSLHNVIIMSLCSRPSLCCVSAALEQHSDQVQSLSWKRDGSLLASSCKVMTTCAVSDKSLPADLLCFKIESGSSKNI